MQIAVHIHFCYSHKSQNKTQIIVFNLERALKEMIFFSFKNANQDYIFEIVSTRHIHKVSIMNLCMLKHFLFNKKNYMVTSVYNVSYFQTNSQVLSMNVVKRSINF